MRRRCGEVMARRIRSPIDNGIDHITWQLFNDRNVVSMSIILETEQYTALLYRCCTTLKEVGFPRLKQNESRRRRNRRHALKPEF
jgi:hypothetical protein